jgi:hypothetical protein
VEDDAVRLYLGRSAVRPGEFGEHFKLNKYQLKVTLKDLGKRRVIVRTGKTGSARVSLPTPAGSTT